MVSAAARAGIRLIQSDEGKQLRDQLWRRVAELKTGLSGLSWATPEAPSAILPLQVGAEAGAVGLMEKLRGDGFFIPAIRHPTVPRNQARLRVTVSASHTNADVQALLNALGGRRVGVFSKLPVNTG